MTFLGVRAWLPKLLLSLALNMTILGCSSQGVEARVPLSFECAGGRNLWLEFGSADVTAILPNRRVILVPKPSSLGEKFASDEGTLIVNEEFASLVLNDDLSYASCRLIHLGEQILELQSLRGGMRLLESSERDSKS